MKKLWCPFHIKGKCRMGLKRPMPHVDEATNKILQTAVQNAAEQEK